MLQLFGMDWVMPSSIADLFFCWYHWLGKHNSDIWNLVLGCLMWNILTERNRRSFEDMGKSLDQLLELCRRTLFDWSRCWGLSDCSTITDFLLSLSIAQCLFAFFFFYIFLLLAHYREPCVFSCLSFFNKTFSYLSNFFFFHMHVPKSYQSDVVLIACHLINCMPSTVLGGQIPYIVLAPNASLFHLPPKIFGCVLCSYLRSREQ